MNICSMNEYNSFKMYFQSSITNNEKMRISNVFDDDSYTTGNDPPRNRISIEPSDGLCPKSRWVNKHVLMYYNDVIMGAMASQITSLSLFVYLIVYSGAYQRKHQTSASLAFVRGIHRWPVDSPLKGPVTWKMFPFDDVIMHTQPYTHENKHQFAHAKINQVTRYKDVLLYWDSHYTEKTVSRPSYFDNGNIHTWKDSLYIETGPWFHLRPSASLQCTLEAALGSSDGRLLAWNYIYGDWEFCCAAPVEWSNVPHSVKTSRTLW